MTADARHKHVPLLDGLRGAAILLVMLHHFGGASGAADRSTGIDFWFSRLMEMGWCGVDLFFVLSGFLITGILHDAKDSARYFRNFYARRALRIFPLYYGLLIVLFVVAPRLGTSTLPGLATVSRHQAWLWLYCSNVAIFLRGGEPFRAGLVQTVHFWSLAVEEQFYLVWPLVVLMVPRARLMRWCVGIAAASLALRAVLVARGYTNVYYFTPCRLDGLMAGAFLALAARSGRGLIDWVPIARKAAGASVVVLGAMWIVNGLDLDRRATATFAFPVLAIFFGATFVLLLDPAAPTWATRAFNGRILRFFGKYSYGLYVFHFALKPAFDVCFSPVILTSRVFHHYWPARLAYVALSIGVSAAVAWVSWQAFEKRFLGLKRFFSDDRAPATADARGNAPLSVPLPVGIGGAVRA